MEHGLSILTDPQRLNYKFNFMFIQTILNEGKKVRSLHMDEVKQTTENPRIRIREDTQEICKELKDAKRDYVASTKRRLQIRNNNIELRQLTLQLRAANVSRQLVEQKEYAEKAKESAINQKRLDDLEYEKERAKNLELTRKQELEEIQKKRAFRESLLKQINHRFDMKKEEYKGMLKDREEMNELMARFEEERKAEQKAAEMRRMRCRDEMLENSRLKEERKQRELSEKIDESEKFLIIMKERELLNMEMAIRKRQELERRQAISERMGLDVQKIKNEKRERDDILLDLLVEERMAKEEFRYRSNLEKQFEERMRVRKELALFGQDMNTRKKGINKEEDDKFHEMQAQTNLEYDRKMAAEEEKRRQNTDEHKRGLLEMIEVNRQERIKETLAELRDHQMRLEAERKQQQEIEEERIRILLKERPENLRYLPVGVLRKSDEQFLNIKLS